MNYTLLDSAPDAIVIVNGRGEIVFANTQTEALFGYDRGELLGRTVEILIPERARQRHIVHRRGFVDEPKARAMGAGIELLARRKNGDEFPVEISLSPLDTDEGPMVASAIRDISVRKHAEAERARLIEERAANLEANRVKDEFLAILSHELRTPLNAILGWSALLMSGRLDAGRAQHAISTIERNATAQAQLVEDLIDLSRVITGKMRLDRTPIDLVDVAEAAVEVVQPGAEAKGVVLEIVAERRPILLLADGNRIQQAIWNLLTNAVKFTQPGGRIDLRVGSDNNAASIAIHDTGKGIDPAFLPRAFDRFRQEDSSSTRAYGGLGLGLAIVRSVVEAHGGSVTARSAGPGTGSTFVMTLPLVATVERRQRRTRSRSAIADQLRDIRVVVVDDTPDELELFAEILGTAGAAVETAEEVRGAIATIEAFQPGVIITDLAMPDQDGYELLRQVRNHSRPAVAHVPVVALTAHARAEDRKRALSAGFQRYLSKPVDPIDLIDTIAAIAQH